MEGRFLWEPPLLRECVIDRTGFALCRDGCLHLLHAPLVGGVVQISEGRLAERIQRIDGQDGVMVARPTEVR